LRYIPIIFFVLLPPPKPVLKTSQRKKIPARRKHRGADGRKSKKYANGFQKKPAQENGKSGRIVSIPKNPAAQAEKIQND